MANWSEHIVLDGWKGLLNDLPLTIGIIYYTNDYVLPSSIFWRLHKLSHSPLCMVGCLLLYGTFRREVYAKMMRHIILDYMTHPRGWLNNERK